MEKRKPANRMKKKIARGGECPHCGSSCRTVPGGTTDNPMETIIYLQCKDVTCGATFRAAMMISTPDEPLRAYPRTAIEAIGDRTEHCAEPAALKTG